MFKVIEDPQFTEDVIIDVPDGDGWRKEVLRTRFRVLPVSEMKALAEAEGAATEIMLDRIVVRFENLADAEGQPVAGDGEWRQRILDWPFAGVALIRAYYQAQAGIRAGNSAPSAAPGPRAS